MAPQRAGSGVAGDLTGSFQAALISGIAVNHLNMLLLGGLRPSAPRLTDTYLGSREPRLEGASIGAVNLSEVVAKLIEDGVPEMKIRRAIGRLELDVHPFDGEHAYAAGVLRHATRALGLSFGDRACLALAQRLGAITLTADRSWARLDLGVAIEVVR